jgi:hypothetical protein
MQELDKKVEIYYKCILKLTNCPHHKVDNNFLTTFFNMGLLCYLHIAPTRRKCNTLLQHKEVVVSCEENIKDAQNYQKKPIERRKNKVVCE